MTNEKTIITIIFYIFISVFITFAKLILLNIAFYWLSIYTCINQIFFTIDFNQCINY